MSSEKDHLAAVVALMGGEARGAYTLADLAGLTGTALPAAYNEVHVMQRLGDGPRRLSLPSETTQWRVLIRSVAQSYVNAQEMRRRADLMLESTVTVGGESSTELERTATSDPIAPDSGWYSGTSEFGYAL